MAFFLVSLLAEKGTDSQKSQNKTRGTRKIVKFDAKPQPNSERTTNPPVFSPKKMLA